jgi:Zn-dependent peptidase ImmA (M78 family)
MATNRVENINPEILRQCREQIGLEMEVVDKKLKIKSGAMENGEIKPTFKQLEKIANLYQVPEWVFISESLPEEYRFNETVPAFRQFSTDNNNIFSDYKVRCLTTRVGRFRNLILEFRDDMDESVELFNPPQLEDNSSPEFVAKQVRDWLGVKDDNFSFSEWKEKLEEKNIFIFLSSKYRGWSHVDKEILRGLAIYHSQLPIIIINDSDAKKAQSFTLFHELGHLLRKENAIDNWDGHSKNVEKWCDEFSGNILMPTGHIQLAARSVSDLKNTKMIAKSFQVSSYACLVRLRQLKIINQKQYHIFETQIIKEYKEHQKRLSESEGGPIRKRSKEILNQYGSIYTRAVFQAYHDDEIGLHKLCGLLDLKNVSHVFEMEGQL